MSNRRVMREDMPTAGKPDGLCEECGKHGNRGLVTLLYSMTPCYTCQSRADQAASARAKALAEDMKADLEREGYHVSVLSWSFDCVDSVGRLVDCTTSASWARIARAAATFSSNKIVFPACMIPALAPVGVP